MARTWLDIVVVAILAGCGGKVLIEPTPRDGNDDCYDCGPGDPDMSPPPKPTPKPKPTPTLPTPSRPPPPDPRPPPPPPPTPILNGQTWPCTPGGQVWMQHEIAAAVSDDGTQVTCKGLVEFSDDDTVEKGIMEDPNGSGNVVSYPYNGASICPIGHIAGHTHCSNIVRRDGKTEYQECTIFALCENGTARATGFSW